ncbi:MAG: repressor LexA, partial [Candidatus Omnitrophica bacterium]|nr:repressor LexA [Candidatus Omnitrophota bacterium]
AKKGFLKREPRARSISLMDLLTPCEQALRVPVVGRVRAGSPVLSEEHVEGHVVVDGGWIGASAESPQAPQHFALKVKGDSMINAGVLDGDYVIVRQQPTAESGEIVVALIGDEATIKRFVKTGDQILLQPEHPTMEPITVTAGQSLTILGKVVAVFRKLG